MKFRLELLGETILVNHVVYCSKIAHAGDKWFFNAIHLSGVTVSMVGETREEVEAARELLLNTKIANDKKHIKKTLEMKK